MRPIKAIAIVSKGNPKINILDIYSVKDAPKPGKDEKAIKVIIKAI